MAEYITRYNATIAATNSIWEGKRSMSDVADAINKIPSEDVAPVRHGKIIETIEDGHMKRTFSCCGTDFTQMTCWMTPNYCPNCGAKMDLEDAE